MESNGRGHTRERLLDDLKMVIKDAEDLLKNTRQQADDGYQMARARFESTLSNARDGLSSLEETAMVAARDAMETADEYVHSNPWQSVGIGALAGLVVGLWLGRR
ncbi:stress response protein ElaB [Noviherbaspirillum agri]